MFFLFLISFILFLLLILTMVRHYSDLLLLLNFIFIGIKGHFLLSIKFFLYIVKWINPLFFFFCSVSIRILMVFHLWYPDPEFKKKYFLLYIMSSLIWDYMLLFGLLIYLNVNVRVPYLVIITIYTIFFLFFFVTWVLYSYIVQYFLKYLDYSDSEILDILNYCWIVLHILLVVFILKCAIHF